jgi:hypothetical protein
MNNLHLRGFFDPGRIAGEPPNGGRATPSPEAPLAASTGTVLMISPQRQRFRAIGHRA